MEYELPFLEVMIGIRVLRRYFGGLELEGEVWNGETFLSTPNLNCKSEK